MCLRYVEFWRSLSIIMLINVIKEKTCKEWRAPGKVAIWKENNISICIAYMRYEHF